MIRKTAPTWPSDGAGDASDSAATEACKPTATDSNAPDSLASSATTSANKSAVSLEDSGTFSFSPSPSTSSQVDSKTDDPCGPSSSLSKDSKKNMSSKRTVEDNVSSESSTQKKIKRKETGRPSLDAKKVTGKKVDAVGRAEKGDKNSAVSTQRKVDDSLASVNGETKKLKEYMKTVKESYFGLQRSTTM